jgi:hypothetical protein
VRGWRREDWRDWLVDYANIVGGPVDKNGFAIDERAIDGAEVAAVRGDGTVVAHHEVGVVGNDYFSKGAIVAVLGGNVGFAHKTTVDEDAAVIDVEIVAGQGDDALDIALRGVAGIVKDYDVSALYGREMVDELVDEKPVAVFEARQHAGALNADGLIEEHDDED